MDLNDEKKKAEYIHKLELRKLFIDKFLIGAIIVLIGISANIVLEKYRMDLAQEEFMIKKKFEAITEIKTAYGELHDFFSIYSIKQNTLPNDYKEQHKRKYEKFIAATNKWDLLLPQTPDEKTEYFLWIHGGIYHKDLKIFRSMEKEDLSKHRVFMKNVRESFLVLTRKLLGIKDESKRNILKLEVMSFSEANALGSKKYYDRNYMKWSQINNNI